LRWLADLAGLPAEAGGLFVPGASVGNLSALVAARHRARTRRSGPPLSRWVVAGTQHTHPSVIAAGDVMDVDFLDVPVDEYGRLTGQGLRNAVDGSLLHRRGAELLAVVATAGTTNHGVVDDLASVAAACTELDVWFHVDGAYGLAGLVAASTRSLFSGWSGRTHWWSTLINGCSLRSTAALSSIEIRSGLCGRTRSARDTLTC
jgi:glutamate/tyrosine decarboxylase-like PLP-dependent enzyme